MPAARLQIIGNVISANLPKITAEDEGKVLAVVNGTWQVVISPIKEELLLNIGSKVPKSLTMLPQIDNTILETSDLRKKGLIYIDANGTAQHATLEQIKQLNTKTVCVDTLTDEKIKTLSNGDIILLRER